MSFTAIICFGENFSTVAIYQVRDIPHFIYPDAGYDGQFYVQIALDPGLHDPQLMHALDLPNYRAHRIFLPFLSFLLGLGIPALIIQVYAMINLVFWCLLLIGLLIYLKPSTFKQYLAIMAIVWSSGTLISVVRALIDLPASALVFFAMMMANKGTLPLFAAAILCKETSILSLASIAWPFPFSWKKLGKTVFQTVVVIFPFAIWLIYVNHQLGSANFWGIGNIEPPLDAFFRQLDHAWANLKVSFDKLNIFEFLAPISLLIQAAYMFARSKFQSPVWRMGIGFAVMLLFMGGSVWVQQLNYTRAVLPLTIAFNLQLAQSEDKDFWWWFIPGNLGLAWAVVALL